MKNKLTYYKLSKIFFLMMILFIIIWCIIYYIESKRTKQDLINNILVEPYTNTQLDSLSDNVYIRKDPNVKVYNVATQQDRQTFMKQNPNIYNRYIQNLASLNMNQGDVKVFVDTRNNIS